jgi:RIO-like serine/threonine protein kinase
MTRLKEIHEAGVLHGDLRLQNLLIDENGRGTIIDFDQSRRTSSQSAMERERARLRELLDQKS